MEFFFCDDTSQSRPSRAGMTRLVAAGSVRVREDALQDLRTKIDAVCRDAGFPEKEPFKWSPGRELWMHDGLNDAGRKEFFLNALAVAAEFGVEVVVVVEDSQFRPAASSSSPEDDVTALLLERIQNSLKSASSNGLVIVDRPGGKEVKEHERFLAGRLEMLASGTKFVRYDRVLLYATMPSKLNRVLQLADLVAGCTTAIVGGEQRYAPPIFTAVKALLRREAGRIGGVGLKIHPDYRCVNLYHWLLGDTHYNRGTSGFPMPLPGRPYATDALVP